MSVERSEKVHADAGLLSWLRTTDHKRIGLLYIGTSLLFFLVAIGLAMLMRTQLMFPQNDFLSPESYNEVFTIHGTTMIFLVVMPLLAGFANYLIPLQIGARDMAFPRMNALSYWVYLGAGVLLYSSFIFTQAVDTGWFSYAPLTSEAYSPHDGINFWILFIIMAGISSVLGAINVAATVLKLRQPGMRLWDAPMFTIANFLNSFLILFALPSLTAATAMLYLDRNFGAVFFKAEEGGNPLIWQHLFWFFGHPEVYILILPAFGMLSEVTPVFSRKPLFGRTAMIIAIGLIGFYGFTVWAHHMFAVGLPFWFNALMAGTSFTIAVPTGIKIFNWLATMWGGSLRFTTSLHFVAGFIALFVLGGLSGVAVATVPFDWQVTDTYFVVAHFHNTLFPGTFFGVMAGLYYWFPKMTGRLLDERLGKVNFWLFFFGFIFTFGPLYIVGLLGMPRRVYTWQPDQGWEVYNLVSTIGGYVIGIGVLVLVYNLISSLRRGRPAGNDPWDAWTLEWATTSPPPAYNFSSVPPVFSPRPLWDLKHPEMPDRRPPASLLPGYGLKAQRHVEPDVAESAAEGPHGSSIPIVVGLALLVLAAGFLTGPEIVVLSVLLLFGALAAWIWQPTPEIETPPQVPAVAGRSKEAEEAGARFTGSSFGIVIFIGSEVVFFGSLFYTYIDLRISQMEWPPPGMPELEAGLPAVATLILVSSGVIAHYALHSLRQGHRGRARMFLGLAIMLGAAFLGIQGYEYATLPFGLSSGVMGTTFFTLTGFHGAHVAAGLLAFGLILARTWKRGDHFSEKNALEAGTYYWHFVDVVWLGLFSLLYLW